VALRPTIEIEAALSSISSDITALLSQRPVPLGNAAPPATTGVYVLSVGTEIMYVGEAKGRKGLKDRLTAKHISGDDSHAIQRAFKIEYPDRLIRRDQIKKTVFAQWLEITPDHRVSAVERVLIWMFNPPWNVK
jgi:hypothetical protein